MNRDLAEFVNGSVDLATLCINRAKLYAQRLIDFEYARTTGATTMTAGTFFDLTTLTPQVKRIMRAYPTNLPNYQIALGNEEKFYRHNAQYATFDDFSNNPPVAALFQTYGNPYCLLWQRAQKVILNPFPPGFTSIPITFVYYQWMPDYVNNTDTDFFLQYCSDFMLYRSVTELNVFLKDNEKVPVSSAKMDEAMKAVVEWNSALMPDDALDAEDEQVSPQ